jgi:PadR family transcriptional regulator PadR
MVSAKTNLLQGTLDLLVLKALGPGELHGLGFSRRIEQITKNTSLVKPGSLFPALHRMEFYRLTTMGIKQIGAETEQWVRVSLAMTDALKAI